VSTFLAYLRDNSIPFMRDGDNNNTHGNGRGWGLHVEKGAGTGWWWGLRHTVRGGNGVKSLSPCHSLLHGYCW